ncbi:MAG: hypothetical protein V4702_02745 [Patescibacteria group bacterium]
MSIPFQGQNPRAASFQDICTSECAISEPSKVVESTAHGRYIFRETLFWKVRKHIGLHLADGEDICEDVYAEDPEIVSKAESCANRIKAGECAKFLLSNGQFPPDYMRGIMTYDAAEMILNTK